MEILTGQTIHGYEIREQIGAGGYGAVYKAFQPSVKREVAVKIILPEHASKPGFAQRFETEAYLVAHLEHPHIIPLYDYWQADDGAFLVMRWLSLNLRQMLRQHGALSLAESARLLNQIAEALAVAHQAGVVHRDLKPDNILLDERGNAYLTDFGIAKTMEGEDDWSSQDSLVGTLEYLSPEQARSETISPQSDIYNLGILLYEMLTGEHPFAGAAPGQMVIKHLHEPIPLVKARRPDLPADIDDVIYRATAKDAAERYPDALALAAAFYEAARLASDTPLVVQPRPETAPQLLSATPERRTPEIRNRRAMLQNVRKFWIEGVLDNSLHGAVLLELGMSERREAVESAWGVVLRTPDASDEALAAGVPITQVFDKLNGKLLVLGDPGGGKTTTLLQLASSLLYRAEMDEAHPIPVVFNLSSWSESRKPLAEWLVDDLSRVYQVPKPVAEDWLKRDELMLLLDGLDEVASAQRDACVAAINAFREAHGFVDVVVCSRIADYEALSQKLRLNGAIVLQSLGDPQVDAYLDRMGPGSGTLRRMLDEDTTLRDLARTPLMLSILMLAYQGISTQSMPEQKSPEAQRRHLFEVYVQRALQRRGSEREYSHAQTLHYLAWLAQKMAEHTQTIFYIENMQPEWLDGDGERRRYLLGTLAAHGLGMLAICTLSGLLTGLLRVGVIIGLIALPAFVLTNYADFRRTRGHIIPLDVLTWSWKAMRHGLTQKFLYSLILVLAGLVAFGLAISPLAGILGGLMSIFAITLNTGFTGARVASTMQPNEGIRRSARNAPVTVTIAGILFGIIAGAVIQPAVGFMYFAIASFGGSISGEPSNQGSAAVIRHAVLRLLLRGEEVMPLSYPGFLDYAASLIFLRKVGGGYIFVHRYLLEYFAELDEIQSNRSMLNTLESIEVRQLAAGECHWEFPPI